MSLAGGLRELLRPPPHRGPLIAAGAVVLAVGLALEEVRLADKVPDGVHMAILLVVGGLIFWLGAQAPNEAGEPPAYQSILLVTGIAMLFAALLMTASVLGADLGDVSAGTLMWTSAVTAGLALWPAFERNSAISLLMAAILGGVALLSAWSWIFHASSEAPYRWLLAFYSAFLVLSALALREPARRHAEVLIDAGGLAIAAIGAMAVNIFGVNQTSLPGIWEVVLLGAGFGLVAFGALDRSPGPAYLGVLNLVLFILVVAESGDETLFWWPLTLILIGAVMVIAGLRPRRPLPPEPNAYRAGEAPLAARADEEELVIRVRDDS
jgi:peptidoglycan/LPS O-acetylase OafA/YrhL